METRWSLKLKDDGASGAAKRIKREVTALNAALRELADVAPRASRALSGVASGEGIRNLRTQLSLTKELNREMRRTPAETRRGGRPPPGGFGGRTRVDGVTPAELQRMRSANDRRRSRDAATDIAGGRDASRRMQRSFRENDRLRRRDGQQAERFRAGQQRSEQQRQRTVDRNWRESRGQMLSLGGRGASAVISGIGSIVSTTLSAIAAVAGLAAGFAGLAVMIGGAILQMISFRESTLMTLRTLIRVPGEAGMNPAQVQAARGTAARGEFRWASQFARDTPLDTQQVVGLRRQAATSGYQGAEARQMTESAADAGALRPDDPTAGGRFILQMGQLRNSSRARAADYRPAAQAAGVSETAAMRRAAIAAGVVQRSGEADPAYQRRVDQAQGRGAITGRQMHDAILAEQRSQLGGRSGDFARSQSGSLAATLSNLGEGFQAFVTSIEDIENLPGIRALKAMLNDVARMLAGQTMNGKALQAIFAGLVNDAAMFVGTIFGDGGFDGALSSALEMAKQIWPIVRGIALAFKTGFMEGFGPFLAEMRTGAGGFLAGGGHDLIQWAREFGRGLAILSVWMLRITAATMTFMAMGVAGIGPLEDFGNWINRTAAGVRQMLNPISRLRAVLEGLATLPGLGGLNPLVNQLREIEGFTQVGRDMGDGVAAGFRERQGHMQSEISAVMASLPTQARTDMQIKSPSRVMAEIGRYMAEGVTVGLDSGAGGVQSAMSSVVAPPGLPGLGSATGGAFGGLGGAPMSVGPFYVQIDGAQDPSGVSNDLQARMVEIMTGVFEHHQLAGGH